MTAEWRTDSKEPNQMGETMGGSRGAQELGKPGGGRKDRQAERFLGVFLFW